jgi:hypothetical protein
VACSHNHNIACAAAVQVPDVSLKEYCRLMESHVTMYVHLEIGIALRLEAVQQQPEAAGQATAVDGAGERQRVW